MRIEINQQWCKGCYICVNVCPRQVLAIDVSQWTGSFHPVYVAHLDRCTACRDCELFCPDLAIEVDDAPVSDGRGHLHSESVASEPDLATEGRQR